MKNCPFSSTPGEVKSCGPDCSFYDTNSDNCGLLEIVGVLKEIKDKSEELKESFIELKNGQTLTGENIKDLPTRENMKDFSNTVREAIEPIPQKIDNYWTVSDTIIGLITKSTVLLEELKAQAKDTQSDEMLGLLKETVASLSEIKQKIDLKNIENSFKDLGNNEKDFFDTLAVDVNNSIEKNQALLIENLSSYLLSASTNIEKLLSEPNYKEIIDFLKLSEEKKLVEREKTLKSLEEFVAKNRNELIGSVESYFSSVKGDLSSLPSSVSEIEKFIKSNNVVEFLRDKESRENELANILLANVSNMMSKNQQSLIESLSIYINSMSTAINALPESMSGIETAVKAGNISDYLKEKEIRDKESSREISEKLVSAIDKNREVLSELIASRLESIDAQFKTLPDSLTNVQKSFAESSPVEFLKEKETRDRQYLGNHLINLAQLLKQNQKELIGSVESYFSSVKGDLSSLPSSVSEIEKFIKSNNVVEFLRDKEARENELANILLANVSNIMSKNQQSLIESLSIYISSMSTAINALPESMSGIENAVKAGNISDYLKEKEIRDKDHLEKTNETLIRTIENGYQEISKTSTEQLSSLNGKLSDMIETIKESGKNDEIKDLLSQINRSETSLGEVLSENTAVLSERYSKEISESFDKLMQNLIPVSKMSAQGIIEIRDEIKENLLAMLTEKDKNDRLFMKEAISRWVEAYGNEQKSLFDLVGGMDERMERIAVSVADISEGRTQTRLVEFLDSFVKNFTAAESKKIQMLIDFREIISTKVLPHLHNISTIAELQKQNTETSIQLTSAIAQQNEMVAKSNQDMTSLIGEASNSIKRAFAAIEKIVVSQNKSVEKLNALSDKLDSILSKQIVVFENEEKNFKLLENENKRSKAMIHNDRGVGFYHTKQLGAAVKEFKTAVDLSPELHEPYLNLGIVFSEMGEKDKAKNCFTKVIEMNPDAVEAYINLGMLYVFDSKFEQAENLIKESLKFSPTYSRSYSALGEVYFRTKNYKLAEEAWKKAVELNPMDEEASSGLKQLRGDDLAE